MTENSWRLTDRRTAGGETGSSNWKTAAWVDWWAKQLGWLHERFWLWLPFVNSWNWFDLDIWIQEWRQELELNKHKELSWSCSVDQVCRARGYLWWLEPDCLAHHRLLTDRVTGWRRSWRTVLRPGLPDWTPTNGDTATEPTGRSKSAHTEPWLEQIDLHITNLAGIVN